MALAPLVREVIGLDLTPAMAMPFAQAAHERGLGNVRFLVGDAESLPFPEEEFHLVTTRRAAHHFPHLPRALTEMARVLRPGGRLGIADMVAPENPEAAHLFNALEATRDNSHVRAYTVEEWLGLIGDVGLNLLHLEAFEEEVAWLDWLYPLDPEGWEAKRAEEVLAQAFPGTRSLVVREGPGGLTLIKRRMVLVALKG
nr:methyltransferase domain-containing protein [Thermus neutrinimicus]